MKFCNQFTLAILLFLVGLLSIGLKTQKAIAANRTISVCNPSSETVSFALAWSNAESMGGGGFGWSNYLFVEGWYNLNAGQCDNYSVDIGSTAVGPSSVWIYGIGQNYEYPSQSVFTSQEQRNLFCIRPSLRFLYTNRQGRGSTANPQAHYNSSQQQWYCQGESQAKLRRFIKLESNNFSFTPNSSNRISNNNTNSTITPVEQVIIQNMSGLVARCRYEISKNPQVWSSPVVIPNGSSITFPLNQQFRCDLLLDQQRGTSTFLTYVSPKTPGLYTLQLGYLPHPQSGQQIPRTIITSPQGIRYPQ